MYFVEAVWLSLLLRFAVHQVSKDPAPEPEMTEPEVVEVVGPGHLNS
jgi:hypothetical protein